MLNSLKLLMHRFRPKTEIDHKKPAQSPCKETELRDFRENFYAPCNEVNADNLNALRHQAHSELHSSDVTARQRDRMLMDKWFNRGDLTNSGAFRIQEFERRMEEMARNEEEIIEPLPAQEDMLMAFSKPEVDLFEEEKISISGVFLKVDPNEDFDEQYSMPLLPMYGSSTAIGSDHWITMDKTEPSSEEFNLDFSVVAEETAAVPSLNTLIDEIVFDETDIEEALQELSSAASLPLMPAPVAAFIKVEAASTIIEDFKPSKIDPSVLFEEWTSDTPFDPTSIDCAPTFAKESTPVETECESTSPIKSKPSIKAVPKQADYWSESDRLTRFGRRKTSASCSSTRLRALTQIA